MFTRRYGDSFALACERAMKKPLAGLFRFTQHGLQVLSLFVVFFEIRPF